MGFTDFVCERESLLNGGATQFKKDVVAFLNEYSSALQATREVSLMPEELEEGGVSKVNQTYAERIRALLRTDDHYNVAVELKHLPCKLTQAKSAAQALLKKHCAYLEAVTEQCAGTSGHAIE